MIIECPECLKAQEYNQNILVDSFSTNVTFKVMENGKVVEITGIKAQKEMLRQHIASCHPFNEYLNISQKAIKKEKVEIEYEEFII